MGLHMTNVMLTESLSNKFFPNKWWWW